MNTVHKVSSSDKIERTLIKPGNINHTAIHRACQIARRLKNRTHYLLRHEKKPDGKPMGHRDVDKHLKRNEPELYQKNPSAIAQRMTQICGQEWKSFYQALKQYKQSPKKFKARPKSPKYSKGAATTYIGRNGFCVKQGYIHFPKALKLQPIPTQFCDHQCYNAKVNEVFIKEVRLVPLGNAYAVETVYDSTRLVVEGDYCPLLDKARVLGIDIGLDNLATLVSNQPDLAPVLINGRILKSINAKYNKDCAQLRAKGKAKHIRAKSAKRFSRVMEYLHKVSRFIVNYCQNNNLGTVIIGKNDDWKQSINIGKVNNQKFVSIPHARLIEQIQYKAQAKGIQVIVREESYTSKASAWDNDILPTKGQNDQTPPLFSGQRIRRGLYRTQHGMLLNADVNGAYNIIRKELGDEVVPLSDKGFVNNPVRISFHNVEQPKVIRTRKIAVQDKPALAA
jgi:putative transposase